MAGILYTNGSRIAGTAAFFDAYDQIRHSARSPYEPVALTLTDASRLDLSDELGSVSATIYLSGAGSNLTSGDGSDFLKGYLGNDRLYGGKGNDVINGGAGNDYLEGGDGDDRIDGYGDEDIIRGGSGNDVIVDQVGAIRDIDAGSGNDRISAHRFDTAGDVFRGRIDGGTGTDRLYFYGDFRDVVVTGIETLESGGSRVTGTIGQFETFDKIAFGEGVIKSENQVLLYLKNGGNLNLLDELGLQGARIYASNTSTTIIAGSGNDYMAGGTGNDTLNGAGGRDKISGSGGNDSLFGSNGDDSLDGDVGNDRLNGGTGNDSMYGDTGKDSFFFNTALNRSSNVDTIEGFSAVDDTIVLDDSVFKALDPGALSSAEFTIGKSAKNAAQHVVYDSQTGDLYYDPDGSGTAGQTVFAKLGANLKITGTDFLVV